MECNSRNTEERFLLVFDSLYYFFLNRIIFIEKNTKMLFFKCIIRERTFFVRHRVVWIRKNKDLCKYSKSQVYTEYHISHWSSLLFNWLQTQSYFSMYSFLAFNVFVVHGVIGCYLVDVKHLEVGFIVSQNFRIWFEQVQFFCLDYET